jgi:hypothetical protein
MSHSACQTEVHYDILSIETGPDWVELTWISFNTFPFGPTIISRRTDPYVKDLPICTECITPRYENGSP